MYIKATDEPTVVLRIAEAGQNQYVLLGNIITNYPNTGAGWVAEYSADVYATLAEQIEVDPENQVDLVESQYIWDYVNHYAGSPRPE